MGELKPCPFCGRQPQQAAISAECECGASLYWKVWQCRPTEDRLLAALEEIAEKARQFLGVALVNGTDSYYYRMMNDIDGIARRALGGEGDDG